VSPFWLLLVAAACLFAAALSAAAARALRDFSRSRLEELSRAGDALPVFSAITERRFRAGRDLSRLYAGYYVAELLNELTHDYDPHPELFDAADGTLKLLAGGEESAAGLVLRFELSALRMLGHLPSLESCVECGSSVEITNRVPFSQFAGGVLCPRCRTGQRGVVSISAHVVRAMAGLANETTNPTQRIELDDRTRGEMRAVLNHYIAHLLGHRPRMHEYLGA
jgi:DNA repair protein RecO (recombination protein O)